MGCTDFSFPPLLLPFFLPSPFVPHPFVKNFFPIYSVSVNKWYTNYDGFKNCKMLCDFLLNLREVYTEIHHPFSQIYKTTNEIDVVSKRWVFFSIHTVLYKGSCSVIENEQ